MKFTPTPLDGAVLVDLSPRGDTRGFFARTFCAETFAAQGLKSTFVQANMSRATTAGTIGACITHETKLMRCTRGAIYDVIGHGPGSPTRGRWFGAELTAENHRAMYVPITSWFPDPRTRQRSLQPPTPPRPSVVCASTIPRSGSTGRSRFGSSPRRIAPGRFLRSTRTICG
jgi:hypothetical protein